jgi:site-specific recombinase XerD
LLEAAQKRAGLQATGGLHILRHTFCSHLAMQGGAGEGDPFQELAGHADLSTTMRYMHLSPAATQDAIALLNGRPAGRIFGEIV